MKKILIGTGIVLVILFVGLAIAFNVLKSQTKKNSPQQTVSATVSGANISVTYSRPSKKGRVIFGELVPYNAVWRTGANEATTFITSKDLIINDKTLAAGTYTLWTIPNTDSWEIILNSKSYPWGLNYDGTSPRLPAFDVINAKVPVEALSEEVEQFTIAVKADSVGIISLSWDKVSVSLPFSVK